jgi:hypothetical protein
METERLSVHTGTCVLLSPARYDDSCATAQRAGLAESSTAGWHRKEWGRVRGGRVGPGAVREDGERSGPCERLDREVDHHFHRAQLLYEMLERPEVSTSLSGVKRGALIAGEFVQAYMYSV